MDVTCDRCDTVYEFDETLLSGRGTPVKCTNCGHVFKVYPRAAANVDRATSHWRLRLHDGSIDTIETLRELQRRISDGELTPEDQIARGDEEWKTLGSIPELDTFFQAAGAPLPAGRIPSPLPPAPSAPRSDSSTPPGRRPRQPTLLGVSPVHRVPAPEPASGSEELGKEPQGFIAPEPVSSPTPVEPAPSSQTPSQEPEPATTFESESPASEASYRSPYADDSLGGAPAASIEDAEFEENTDGALLIRGSTPPPFYDDDDGDIPELPARGSPALRWLLLILVIGGLALVAVEWERVASFMGVGGDPAAIAAGISEGDAALDEAHPEAYARAVEAYRRALEAGGGRNAELLAKLSNAYALIAQSRLDAGEPPDRVPFITEAMSTATAAADLDRARLDARLAVVDALRLNGADEEAREQLEQARGLSFSRTPEFFRVEARLSQAEGQLQNGLRSARQAAELAPHSARYLLLHARAELAAGNQEAAREVLQEVLDDAPGHPVAEGLMETLEAESETDVASPETETDTEAETETETEAATEAATEAETETETEAETEAETETETEAEAETKTPIETETDTEPAEEAAKASQSTKPAGKKPTYDEYDRLAQSAASDAFVDGRPPVTDYETNMTKGRQELDAGNYARARAYFDSALEVHPGSADAMDALGDVATAVSDYGSAIRYYRVAAQRGHTDGYYKLGQSYERLGRNEEAVSAYYTYLRRRPTGRHASDAREKIKTLEPRVKLPPELESPPTTDSPPSQDPSSPSP